MQRFLSRIVLIIAQAILVPVATLFIILAIATSANLFGFQAYMRNSPLPHLLDVSLTVLIAPLIAYALGYFFCSRYAGLIPTALWAWSPACVAFAAFFAFVAADGSFTKAVEDFSPSQPLGLLFTLPLQACCGYSFGGWMKRLTHVEARPQGSAFPELPNLPTARQPGKTIRHSGINQ